MLSGTWVKNGIWMCQKGLCELLFPPNMFHPLAATFHFKKQIKKTELFYMLCLSGALGS